MPSRRLSYDVAVLGGGPGGMAAALRAALRGAKVCLIEQKHLGGVCLNVGCIPTKAMLAASDLYWRMRHAEQFGIRVERASVDGKAFMKRVADVVRKLRRAAERKVASRKGLDVIRGRGRLTGPDALAVQTEESEKRIKAGCIVIATGSRPVKPNSLPWDSPRIVTSDFSGDGYVDGLDYVQWSNNYGQGCPGVPGAVPEPAALSLLALGAVVLIRRRAR